MNLGPPNGPQKRLGPLYFWCFTVYDLALIGTLCLPNSNIRSGPPTMQDTFPSVGTNSGAIENIFLEWIKWNQDQLQEDA